MRKVAAKEDVFDIIKDFHYTTKHIGYQNTHAQLNLRYSNIPRTFVEEFVKLCPTCNENRNQITRAPLTPIISCGFLQRLQIDLIDMRSDPDGDKKWIGHAVDHFSKFHILFPLQSKEAKEVSRCLKTFVFAYFGLPLILHSDNGKEFVNSLITELVNHWPGECKIIHGSPRKPWVQGCVERYNACVGNMIMRKKSESKCSRWVEWLPEIQFTLNSMTCRTIKKQPFEVVFGQLPNTLAHIDLPRSRDGFIYEEEVSHLIENVMEGNHSVKTSVITANPVTLVGENVPAQTSNSTHIDFCINGNIGKESETISMDELLNEEPKEIYLIPDIEELPQSDEASHNESEEDILQEKEMEEDTSERMDKINNFLKLNRDVLCNISLPQQSKWNRDMLFKYCFNELELNIIKDFVITENQVYCS